MPKSTSHPTQSIPVFRSADLSVVNGANLGDPISFAAELDLDDTYELNQAAEPYRLSLQSDGKGGQVIAPETAIGTPGATLHMDCCLTLMSGNGVTTEVLVLVEVDGKGDVEEIYALPLAPLTPRLGYSLVGINSDSARTKFAEVACVSFTRGTHITLTSGEQKCIEELNVGDTVLTRDDGPQKIRWIGHATVRATGDFAPIRIKAGALHNENDLLVSPDHRLFIYQRSDALGAGRNELLVRARHLVNGDTVIQEDGGFVDYFQLLFDEHQIIYAEGIAAETLLVDTRTRPVLPAELSQELAKSLPDHADRAHMQFEIGESLLNHPDMAKLLKRASTR
ncbi:Hint domain-containing protein [uncultured Roseovarius sp.]|uniref:Hint domain-containing protein n=1 Tax=uncultured Roseovarius sp. TaxID=293344 RepID=UPI00260D35A2|nr:Hint domain-containing protein [uncultured Roseovarius sp.]